MHRFYFESANFNQQTITISDQHEVHHIKDVLRLKTGDELSIFNGLAQEALCVLDVIKESAIVVCVKSIKQASKRSLNLILACAVPKKAKFEFIIEKCTELGVDVIIPLKTKRSDVIYSKDKIALKQQRFQKVAINAAKQCGRQDVPKIYHMTEFKELFLSIPKDAQVLIASLVESSIPLIEAVRALSKNRPIVILIGPEGDFTADEVAFAKAQGTQSISLGNTVLKVDTAAMTSVAFCRFFLYN